MKIGYARVSTKWYQSEIQVSELEKQGCEKVWQEDSLATQDTDAALKKFVEQISKGDAVVATRLSSVASSGSELLRFLQLIQKKGASFRSIAEPWADTSGKNGQQVIETIRGMIDFELAVADAESRIHQNRPKVFGVAPGRPKKLSAQKRSEAISLLGIGKSAAEISRLLGVSRSTISRLKKKHHTINP